MKLSHLAAGLLITTVGAAGCIGDSTEQGDEQAITAAECRATPGAPECQIYGTVVDAFIGEMDPFVVGDVCVLFVQKEGSDKLYGLVEDFDWCTSTARYSERLGTEVYFSKGQITYVADKEARDELKSYQEAVYHYLEGEVYDAEPAMDAGDAVAQAFVLGYGADPALTTRVELADIPEAARETLQLEAESLADRFPGTDYQAEVDGYYAVHPAVEDDTVVAYAFYATGYGEPDYHDWIIFGVDLDGEVVYSDEDSG